VGARYRQIHIESRLPELTPAPRSIARRLLRRLALPCVGKRYGICSLRLPAYDNAISAPRRATRATTEASNMIRYGFTIRTRTGQRVDNVSIIAGSQLDAERRLRQMYVQCEIVECRERSIPRRFEAANMHLIDLMAISPPTIQHHG
jgi:hypothetical protein